MGKLVWIGAFGFFVLVVVVIMAALSSFFVFCSRSGSLLHYKVSKGRAVELDNEHQLLINLMPFIKPSSGLGLQLATSISPASAPL